MAPSPGGPYVRPRIVVAGALTGLLSVLLLLDALSDTYTVSEVTLTVLIGGILTALGAPAVNDWLRGGKA